MEFSLKRTGVALANGLLGAIVGGIAITLALPSLRQIDSFGYSPVVLISCAVGAALAWSVRMHF